MLSYVTIGILAFLYFSSLGFSETMYKYKNKEFGYDDLSSALKQELYDVDYQTFKKKQNLLEQALVDAYFAEQATKEKKSALEVQENYFKIADPKEDEIKAFYEKYKERIPQNYTYDTVKPQLTAMLVREKEEAKRSDLIKKLTAEKGNSIELKEPEPPVVSINTAGYPFKGAEKASVTLVEFADYQCPHCFHAYSTIKKMWPKFEKNVKLVYIDYPINHSGISTVVAEGAFCAAKQNKYWEYHSMAFEKQKELKKDSPEKFAKELKLNEAEFSKCLADQASKDAVANAKREGDRIGVTGTPALFVNGKRVNISRSVEEALTEALNSALEANKKVL